jgi:DNA mismatch repair ATPase MutS
MKAHLMFPDQDFDMKRTLPSNAKALIQDLELSTMLDAMARKDEFLFEVAKVAVLSSLDIPDAIRYRQHAVSDCLAHPSTVFEMYNLAVESIVAERKVYRSLLTRRPDGILHRAVEVLEMFVLQLKKLRQIADEQASGFESEAFTNLFAMLSKELDDEYFASIDEHLRLLHFRNGVVISARLGKGNKGLGYVLRKPNNLRRNWVERLSGRGRPETYGFQIADRDEAGFRALEELRGRGINLVANALAQSTDHILNFFVRLREELGFYVGCLNLHRRLEEKGEPTCLPVPVSPGQQVLSCRGLYDVCLSLSIADRTVGNDVDVGDRSLVVITGANRGGKSTFLRSVGLAQLMMQCGIFVPAAKYRAEVRTRLFTHFKREEDSAMEKGKLDEELSRMSEIADELTPDSMVLFNESFASTNESEGAEIAAQVIDALLDARVMVVIVTHLYELAERLQRDKADAALFLRAERLPDGGRTFKLIEAGPLPTSYGEDLYEQIFGTAQTASARVSTAGSSEHTDEGGST